MESKIGLVIQFTGIFLITGLSLFLRRSLKTTTSTLWLAAWCSLSVALCSLSLAISFSWQLLYAPYFFFEYIFGLLLIFGCRSLADDFKFKSRSLLPLIPFSLLTLILSAGMIDTKYIFKIHALILGAFFAGAFLILKKSHVKSFGRRVMIGTLVLLSLDFFHYAAWFLLSVLYPGYFPDRGYLSFEPLIDLVLEVTLGFGMVVVLLEQVLREIKNVNVQLNEAHEKLKRTAHVDPLTTAFNRHAFYGFLENKASETVSGCVGFFDIDDLKPINDQLGHSIGDHVIRRVVRVIRDLIRAEDLIYRWGGDEFFVVMLGISEDSALSRVRRIDRLLTDVMIEGVDRPLTVRVSYGFKGFDKISELETAVKSADEEMYRRKLERKARRRNYTSPKVLISNENILVSIDR